MQARALGERVCDEQLEMGQLNFTEDSALLADSRKELMRLVAIELKKNELKKKKELKNWWGWLQLMNWIEWKMNWRKKWIEELMRLVAIDELKNWWGWLNWIEWKLN